MSAATLPRFRDQRVADFMRAHDRIGAQRCKGWLRLEFVFDLLHQGKARVESPVHHLLILPFIGVKPDERVEQALLRFAQTAIGNLPSRMGRVD